MPTGSTANTKKSAPIGSSASATKRICAAWPGGRSRAARAGNDVRPAWLGTAVVPPATAMRLRADRLVDHGVDVLLGGGEGGVGVLLAEGHAGEGVVDELEKGVAVAHRADPLPEGEGGKAGGQRRGRLQDLRIVDEIGTRGEGEGS